MVRNGETIGSECARSGQEILSRVDELLADGYRMWEEYRLPVLTDEERHQAAECAAAAWDSTDFTLEYAAACQCFYLFRRLHTMVEEHPEQVTLLGDYFFSRFSHFLIPIDSTRLIDLFSEYLKGDALRQSEGKKDFDPDGYLRFIRETAKEIKP